MITNTRLSFSATQKYLTCPRAYKHRYVDRFVSKQKGSALCFGVAIDEALGFMLNHKDDKEVLRKSIFRFDRRWSKQQDNSYIPVRIKDNVMISYYKSDFDENLLNQSDWDKLFKITEHPLEARDIILANKKSVGWKNIPESDKKFFNYSSWLSLRRKGHLMLKAYFNDIIPNIKKVLGTQIPVDMISPEGDKFIGFIDLVAVWKDDSIILFDNKTSSKKYEFESVSKSEQLGVYKLILDNYFEDPKHIWKHQIQKAGFLVLIKALKKNVVKICQTCNHTVTGGAHITCDNKIEKKRCGGTWTISSTLIANTQIVIDNIEESVLDSILETINIVNTKIKAEEFPQNLDSCMMPYGACDFINYCHNNQSMEDLITLPEKTK